MTEGGGERRTEAVKVMEQQLLAAPLTNHIGPSSSSARTC